MILEYVITDTMNLKLYAFFLKIVACLYGETTFQTLNSILRALKLLVVVDHVSMNLCQCFTKNSD